MTIEKDDIPNARDEPLKAAYLKLQQARGKIGGDLYDEHEEVREVMMDIEWAYTAIAEHDDIDIDEISEEFNDNE